MCEYAKASRKNVFPCSCGGAIWKSSTERGGGGREGIPKVTPRGSILDYIANVGELIHVCYA